MVTYTSKSGLSITFDPRKLRKHEYMTLEGPVIIEDGRDLRIALAKGLVKGEIERFSERQESERIMDQYLAIKEREGKLVKERSSGVFDQINAKGDWVKEKEFNADDAKALEGHNIEEKTLRLKQITQ